MPTAADVLALHPEFAVYDPPIAADQQMLLDVICRRDAGAQERFQSWLNSVDIQDLDGTSYRLYPFLAERIVEFAPRHPLLHFFRGNARKTFYTNSLLFRRAAERFAKLQAAGVPVLILKGAALIHSRAYRTGMRPMADIDFLIPTESLGPALEILTPLKLASSDVETLRDYQHGHTITDDLGFEFDLHWHAMPQCCGQAEKNSHFWEASEATSFYGVPVRCLNPTDSMLIVCVHGIRWNPVPPIRWIPDTLNLLEKHGEQIDWPRLAWLAGETRSTLLLLMALRYLRRRFDAVIPAAAMEMLEGSPVETLEAVSLPLAFVPWNAHLPWSLAEPVLREQVRLQSQRSPQPTLVVPLDRDHWNPQQSRLCEKLGCVPIVKARSLPAEWRAAVEQHLRQQKNLLPAFSDFHRRHPGVPVTYTLQLSSPDSGRWQILIQSDPKGPGRPPELRVVSISQSSLETIPPEAMVLDATSCFLANPFPSRLPAIQQILKLTQAENGRS